MCSRVLITGFLPFAGAKQNISAEVARLLGEGGETSVELCVSKRIQFEASVRRTRIEFEHRILTVDERGASEIAMSNIAKYDSIIHLGLASEATEIKIESQAKNWFNFRFADESGRLNTAGPIIENQPDFLTSTATMKVLQAEFKPNRFVIFSNDAGGFVCNETYFRTLAAHRKIAGGNGQSKSDDTTIHSGRVRRVKQVDEETRPIPILFVHLPSEEHIETKIQAEIVAQIAAVTLAKPRQYVVGAVIEREGNILCCRRGKGENMAGYWEFPGGKIKEGESKKEALSREIEEELSMKISLHDSIQTVEHHELNRVIQITFLRATIDVGEPILSVHDEYRWLPRDQLSELEWLAADSSIIELLKN